MLMLLMIEHGDEHDDDNDDVCLQMKALTMFTRSSSAMPSPASLRLCRITPASTNVTDLHCAVLR